MLTGCQHGDIDRRRLSEIDYSLKELTSLGNKTGEYICLLSIAGSTIEVGRKDRKHTPRSVPSTSHFKRMLSPW